MTEGTVGLEKSTANFSFFGFGSTDLNFYQKGKKRRKVLSRLERVQTFRCERCKTLVIKPYN